MANMHLTKLFLLQLVLTFLNQNIGNSFSLSQYALQSRAKTSISSSKLFVLDSNDQMTRRKTLHSILIPIVFQNIQSCTAYEPDSDPLRESLYLISRVQEATVQQERFVRKSYNQQDLKNKMKLTLRLIEKNYKLVDQLTYCSGYLPSEHLVEATEAGNEAAELQSVIDE